MIESPYERDARLRGYAARGIETCNECGEPFTQDDPAVRPAEPEYALHAECLEHVGEQFRSMEWVNYMCRRYRRESMFKVGGCELAALLKYARLGIQAEAERLAEEAKC